MMPAWRVSTVDLTRCTCAELTHCWLCSVSDTVVVLRSILNQKNWTTWTTTSLKGDSDIAGLCRGLPLRGYAAYMRLCLDTRW